MFQRPGRTGLLSAWHGHVPFAHWFVGAVQPRCLVELGVHTGASYFAFCEAVQRNGLDTRCYAVDTWTGDQHAGSYGDEVFDELRAYHDPRFAGFSTLLRCRFDEALDAIADGTVDLLHIDGLHTYDAVRHDFEAWQPKLSDRAVVLFHDTNERHADFGVWRLWAELRERHPGFEFPHAHGLGVLGVGSRLPPMAARLMALDAADEVAAVRDRFSLLGERWQVDMAWQQSHREVVAEQALHAELRAMLAGTAVEEGTLRAEVVAAEARAERAEHRAAALTAALAAAEAAAAALDGRLRASEAHAATLQSTVATILESSYWKAGRPLRAVLGYIPAPLRLALRRAGRASR